MVGDPRVVVPDLPNTKLAVGDAVGSGQLRVLREFGDGGQLSQPRAAGHRRDRRRRRPLPRAERAEPIGGAGRRARAQDRRGGRRRRHRRGPARRPGGGGRRASRATSPAMPGRQPAARGGRRRPRARRGPRRPRPRAPGDRAAALSLPLQPRAAARHLVLLSADDREYLAEEDGAIEADCVFCGNHYRFTSSDLARDDEVAPS